MSQDSSSAGTHIKAFVTRGNVVELTAAVILGIAFSQVLIAVVEGIIAPLIQGIGIIGPWSTILGYVVMVPVAVFGLYVFVVRPLNRRHDKSREAGTH